MKSKNLKMKTFGLFVGVAFVGFMANQTGFGGLSGQGVGGEEQVGCGGDMSGFAIGHDADGSETLVEAGPVAAEDRFYVNDSQWLGEFANDEERIYRAESIGGDCSPEIQSMAGTADFEAVENALSCIFRLPTTDQKVMAFENFATVAHGNTESYWANGLPDGEEIEGRLGQAFAEEVESAMNMGLTHPGLVSIGFKTEKGLDSYGNYCGAGRGICVATTSNCGGAGGAAGQSQDGMDAICETHDQCVVDGGGGSCDDNMVNSIENGNFCKDDYKGWRKWRQRLHCQAYAFAAKTLMKTRPNAN